MIIQITKITLSKEVREKIPEKTPIKSEQPASCTQKTVKRRAPAVNNPERVGSKNPDGCSNNRFKICLTQISMKNTKAQKTITENFCFFRSFRF